MGTDSEANGICGCTEGFLPLMNEEGELTECHDPIMLAAVVGSR